MPDTQTTTSSLLIDRETADQIIFLAVVLVIIPASSAAILWGILPFYIGDAHASANEILTLVHQAAALRAGKQGSFLLLTDDGTPPTQVHIDGYGDLVFEPVAELTIPPGRT